MRYDIPDMPKPAKVVMHKDSREVVFPLPYPADGLDADLLSSHPLVRLVANGPSPEPVAPLEESPKPSRKEV